MKLVAHLSNFFHILVMYLNVSVWEKNHFNLESLELKNDKEYLSKIWEQVWAPRHSSYDSRMPRQPVGPNQDSKVLARAPRTT